MREVGRLGSFDEEGEAVAVGDFCVGVRSDGEEGVGGGEVRGEGGVVVGGSFLC